MLICVQWQCCYSCSNKPLPFQWVSHLDTAGLTVCRNKCYIHQKGSHQSGAHITSIQCLGSGTVYNQVEDKASVVESSEDVIINNLLVGELANEQD